MTTLLATSVQLSETKDRYGRDEAVSLFAPPSLSLASSMLVPCPISSTVSDMHAVADDFCIFSLRSARPRLMSDYDVNLVNDSMSEFFVKFHGPSESESSRCHLYDLYVRPFSYIDN